MGLDDEFLPAGEGIEGKVRPRDNCALTFAPGSRLIPACKNAVAAGDYFVGEDVLALSVQKIRVPKSYHFLQQSLQGATGAIVEKTGQLLLLVEHVPIEGEQGLFAEGADQSIIDLWRNAVIFINGAQGASDCRS